MFSWHKPARRVLVDGYRIERTRDEDAYEPVANTEDETLHLPTAPLNAGRFYRVTAFNTRGQGPAEWVFFSLHCKRNSILQRVPVRPGLCVGICELFEHENAPELLSCRFEQEQTEQTAISASAWSSSPWPEPQCQRCRSPARSYVTNS